MLQTLAIGVTPSWPSEFTYYQIDAMDTVYQDLSSYFESTTHFIHSAITEEGGSVLVHW